MDYRAEASGVPPISPSGGFLCFVCLFFSWVAGEKGNRGIQALLKPEAYFCFGGKDGIRLAFLIVDGIFQDRI